MTRREQAVLDGKLEDMTFSAWMHMLEYEFVKTGKLTSKEAKNYVQSVDTWRENYDDGYTAEDVAVDEMSYWGD